jgi:hypothetical protein
VDSPGNDIFALDGQPTPEEMVLEVYRWEAQHPGQIIPGFTIGGDAKSLIPRRNLFAPPRSGLGMYVRVSYDDSWIFVVGASMYDGCASNFSRASDADIGIIQSLRNNETAIAFDSLGETSGPITLFSDDLNFKGRAFMGTWIKTQYLKSSEVSFA